MLLFDEIVTEDIVGAVLSKVMPLPSVVDITWLPAFPAGSRKSIVNRRPPSSSVDVISRTASQELFDPEIVALSPPTITVGVCITSLVVKFIDTSSSTLARLTS